MSSAFYKEQGEPLILALLVPKLAANHDANSWSLRIVTEPIVVHSNYEACDAARRLSPLRDSGRRNLNIVVDGVVLRSTRLTKSLYASFSVAATRVGQSRTSSYTCPEHRA